MLPTDAPGAIGSSPSGRVHTSQCPSQAARNLSFFNGAAHHEGNQYATGGPSRDESKWHSFVFAFDGGSDGVWDGDGDDVGGDILDAGELLCGGFMPG